MSCIPKYEFTKEISKELEAFRSGLKQQGMIAGTARQHRNYTGIYLEWLADEGIQIRDARYKDVITFSGELQSRNHSARFINRILLAIRHYYKYLGVEKNPASGIYIRGLVRKVSIDVVDYEEILELYERYQSFDNRTKRNKVMLSLMVYQAVTTRELHRLEPHHIQLKEAKIYIPGDKRSLPRVLKLEASQVLELNEYLMEVRPELIRNIDTYRSGRKIKEVDYEGLKAQLFFSEGGNTNIKQSLYHMFRLIKKINPKISSVHVIRTSVITEWTKSKGLRQVQYMAGYRWVGSVERYKNYNLTELKQALNEYHPLK